MTVKKVKRWKPSKDADSHCDGRVEECFCDQLDDLGDCIDCGSTQKERDLDASNEQQTPIEPYQPDAIEDAIESLAVRTLDTIKRLIKFPADNVRKHRTTENQLAALIAAGRPFSDVMQTFAGFLTEHTMTIETVEASDLTTGNGIKLQDSKAALIERNGGTPEN